VQGTKEISRLGHLMLYDNEDQLEVRHVISLAHFRTDIYAGGDKIPEGELWIKRNCRLLGCHTINIIMLTIPGIRLVQQHDNDTFDDTKSFYLFSDNCSEKEDFYHAMLQAQEHHQDHNARDAPPIPLKFDTTDLVKLVQQLHASEENLHTRWINALIGRVFLGVYKTAEIKNFIATKITKKIARVPKPALISSVTLRSIDMGTLPPFLTNPKLKELTVDGDLVVEADISYKGNFRIEIAAIARIDLGARFKAREVTLVLAAILKRLDGHILIRIKPPPSNRLWMTFETPPRMEMSVEPIVSSRQITYGVILRAIESRIREVLNETLVLPNWDDMPFTDTLAQEIRGGIWQKDTKSKEQDAQKDEQEDVILEKATIDAEKLDEKADAVSSHSSSSHISIPSIVASEEAAISTSSSTDLKSSTVRPRPMRSSSSAAQVCLDSANASAEILRERESLTPTSVRSLPLQSPTKSPLRPDKAHSIAAFADTSEEDLSADASDSPPLQTSDGTHGRSKSRELTAEEIASAAAAAAAAGAHNAKKTMFNQSLNTATAAARNWLTSKQNTQPTRKPSTASHQRNTSTDLRPPTSETHKPESDSLHDTPTRPDLHTSISKSHTEPMGRGHPLPPPGTPLPLPSRAEKRQTWALPAAASTFANIAKRKPVAGGAAPSLGEKRSREHLRTPTSATHNPASQPASPYFSEAHDGEAQVDPQRAKSVTADDQRQVPRRKSSVASVTSELAAPPLPRRRQQRQQSVNLNRRTGDPILLGGEEGREGVFVVKAPVEEELEGSGKKSLRSNSGSDKEDGGNSKRLGE
jgi:hypothetical protein